MTTGLSKVVEMLNLIITNLLNADDIWRLETIVTTGTTLLLVKTSNPGPLIGRQGSTIKAIRELVSKAATAHQMTCHFDVAEGV